MSRHAGSLPASYFEGLYAADPDPWRFATSDYERDKYAATLGALPRERYARALDVGCSVGVLTRALADRCDALVAMDPVRRALDAARSRCADSPHVGFVEGAAPATWPDGVFDLILLSEVVYYLDPTDGARLGERAGASLAPTGDILLVHWTGETNYPLSGDEAAERFIGELGRAGLRIDGDRTVRRERYRLDVLRREA